MAATLIGVGAYADGNTSAANVTYNWPSGYTPASGDLALIFQTGYSNNSSALVNTASGYTRFINQHWFWTTSTFLMAQTSYKVLTGAESAPVCNTSSNTSSGNGGTPAGYAGGFVAIYRGLNTSVIPAQETPTSANGTTNVKSTASTTTTSGSITTTSPDALVVTMICGTVDSSLTLSTANGFTAQRTASASAVAPGCIGMADYTKTTPGAVSMPTWTSSSMVAISLTFSIDVSAGGFCVPGLLNPMA